MSKRAKWHRWRITHPDLGVDREVIARTAAAALMAVALDISEAWRVPLHLVEARLIVTKALRRADEPDADWSDER